MAGQDITVSNNAGPGGRPGLPQLHLCPQPRPNSSTSNFLPKPLLRSIISLKFDEIIASLNKFQVLIDLKLSMCQT